MSSNLHHNKTEDDIKIPNSIDIGLLDSAEIIQNVSGQGGLTLKVKYNGQFYALKIFPDFFRIKEVGDIQKVSDIGFNIPTENFVSDDIVALQVAEKLSREEYGGKYVVPFTIVTKNNRVIGYLSKWVEGDPVEVDVATYTFGEELDAFIDKLRKHGVDVDNMDTARNAILVNTHILRDRGSDVVKKLRRQLEDLRRELVNTEDFTSNPEVRETYKQINDEQARLAREYIESHNLNMNDGFDENGEIKNILGEAFLIDFLLCNRTLAETYLSGELT